MSLNDVLQLGEQDFVNVSLEEDDRMRQAFVRHERLLDLHKHFHIAIHPGWVLKVKSPPGVESEHECINVREH